MHYSCCYFIKLQLFYLVVVKMVATELVHAMSGQLVINKSDEVVNHVTYKMLTITCSRFVKQLGTSSCERILISA